MQDFWTINSCDMWYGLLYSHQMELEPTTTIDSCDTILEIACFVGNMCWLI